MALSTGVELAMGGEDEDAIGSVQYMCIAVMAVTVSSYKLLELSVGPQYGRLCQLMIFAICVPLYLRAFDSTAQRVKRVGVAGFNKLGQSLVLSIEYDRRVVMAWVWDAAGKLEEFELSQRCRLKELDEFASKGAVDAVAVVEGSVLGSHGVALLAAADLVLCDASPLTDPALRRQLLDAAASAGRQIHVARAGTPQAAPAPAITPDVFRTHSKTERSTAAPTPSASWAAELQQLSLGAGVRSVQLTFTQPAEEVEAALPTTGAAFAGLRSKLKAWRRGGGEPLVLHEGGGTAALSSAWASALDPRLTHALGCAILALQRQKTTHRSQPGNVGASTGTPESNTDEKSKKKTNKKPKKTKGQEEEDAPPSPATCEPSIRWEAVAASAGPTAAAAAVAKRKTSAKKSGE